MIASFSGFWRRYGRARTVFAITVVAAFLSVPALAYAARGTTTRADLAGPAGYCWNYDGAAGAAIGKVQIATSPASSSGFHPVRVDIKMHADRIPAGSYQVWLVNLYRDEAGQVIGCAASPFANPLTVESGSSIDFRGSLDRYTGEYDLQVYVGPIWGPGYGTSPLTVDVP
jgi:hypothetical protein